MIQFSTLSYDKKLPLETLLSFGLSLLILLCAFLPFWLGSRFIFQNQTGLLVVITALSAMGCAFILIKRVFISNEPKTFTQLDFLLSVFVAYLLIQTLFYPINREYILALVCLAATYFLFRQIPSRLTSILLFLLPILAVFQIVYAHNRLTEPWQGLSDIVGGFGNTGIFGGFVAMGFVAALGLLISTKQSVIRIILSILLIPLAVSLLYSQSRAAWLAAIVGSAVLLLPPVFRRLKKRNSLIIIALLAVVGVFLSINLYHFKKDSADGRILIWTVSSKMILEKPITGFGITGFQKNYLLHQGEYFKNNPDSRYADLADSVSSPFNEWLKIGVEQGIIGLLFVLSILFTAFRHSSNAPPLRAILTALFVFACFSYPFSFAAFQVLGVFCLAGVKSPVFFGTRITRITQVYTNIFFRNKFLYKIRFALICVIRVICVLLILSVCGFVLTVSHKHYTDIKEWNQTFHTHSPEERIDRLQTLYPALQHNAAFVSVFGRTLHSERRYDEAIPLLEAAVNMFPSAHTFILLGDAYEKTGAYSQALTAWKTASHIMPVLFTPLYDMAKLYHKLGDNERAKQKAEKILNKNIKINSPRIQRMKREMEILYKSSFENAKTEACPDFSGACDRE